MSKTGLTIKTIGKEAESITSDEIIADLLNQVKSSEQPFSVEKLAEYTESNTSKHIGKHHKEKSKKKKEKSKKRKKSRSRSSSRKRNRSKSPSRRHSKKRKKEKRENRSRSRSRSRSRNRKLKSKEKLDVEGEHFSPSSSYQLEKTAASNSETISSNLKQNDIKESNKNEKNDLSSKLSPSKNEKLNLSFDTTKRIKEDFEKKKPRKRSRSASSGGSEGEMNKKQFDRKHSNKESSNRNRSNSREKQQNTSKKREKEVDRYRRRSTSRDKNRRRRSPSYERSINRRKYHFDDYRKKRSPSRERIDKKQLLEIAKMKRAKMCASAENKSDATIDDFVSYCQRLQQRQEKDNRRERGEAVSDDNSDDEIIKYKHPYALPKDPIKINIITATTSSLAQKALPSTQEKELDSTQLRLVFPVSSGAVHKENSEWKPVIKNNDNIPKSCTNEQKKHVALTSVEIEKCRQQGIPVVPKNVPTFLESILPPPPPPPRFLPDPYALSESPPQLPSVLYVPPKEKMIIKEPDVKLPAPTDLSATLKQRADSQKRLYSNPNDFEAHRALREANSKIELWATLKSLPGKYTGSTGLKLLSAEELQPSNPKYHAWVKRDQFKNAQPAIGGVGLKLMEKMGWKLGEGLGKDATGCVEPLLIDVKNDRKGLIAEQEQSIKQRNKNAAKNSMIDLTEKNPISLLMEICAKRKWPNPQFSCEEEGSDHCKIFTWTVTVNNTQYRPLTGSRQKKEGKTVACQVALQSMGILPRDPDLPVTL